MDYDPAKDAANIAKHGISLARHVDLEPTYYVDDRRKDYGERRFIAYSYLDGRPVKLVFTWRDWVLRPISLQPVHEKEFLRRNQLAPLGLPRIYKRNIPSV